MNTKQGSDKQGETKKLIAPVGAATGTVTENENKI